MINRISQLIKDNNEHINLIKRSLVPNLDNSSIGCPENILGIFNDAVETINSKVIKDDLFNLINQTPTISYLFLGLPLQQTIPHLTFTTINTESFTEASDIVSIPNIHRESDPSKLFSVLKQMSRKERRIILNSFPDIQSADYPVFEKAIMEPELDSLKLVICKNIIDISAIQKSFGLLLDSKDFSMMVKQGHIPDEDTFDVFSDFFKALVPLFMGNPYDRELLEKTQKIINKQKSHLKIKEDEALEWCSNLTTLRIKSYWYEHDNYNEYEVQLVDDFLANPYFEKIIAQCRAEFDEDERLRTSDSNDEYGWLPVDFFNVTNTPSGGKNWIKGLRSEVEKGYKYINDPREKEDARIKFALMIEQCVKEGIIHDDIDSRKRLAYLLTGRKVGVVINDNKVIFINEDKLPLLVYIVRFLFNNINGKYDKMFGLVDGVGKYQHKVGSAAELIELNNSPHKYKQKDISRLAEKAEVYKSFGPFMHSLYDFCPESVAALRRKNQDN